LKYDKILSQIRRIAWRTTPVNVKRNLKIVNNLAERIPETAIERRVAMELVSGLVKLHRAIEIGWIEEQEIEEKIPRRWKKLKEEGYFRV